MLDLILLITLLGAVQGIFFGLVLLRLRSGNRLANRFLALFLLIFSISMLGIAIYSNRWVLKAPHLGLVHTPLGAVQGVPFLLYVLALTRQNFRPQAQHWALFITPVVVVVAWLMPFYILPLAEKRAVLEASYTVLPHTWRAIFIFSNILNFVCLAASYLLIARHERVIKAVYSSPLHKSLTWMRDFWYAGFGTFAICVLCSFYGITWADTVSNLIFSGVIYFFGYRAMRQPDIFGDVSPESLPEEESLPLVRRAMNNKYEKSSLSKAKAESLLEQLEQLMLNEKVYLNPTLNLPQLAERLSITPHQLSQLLNQFQGETFSDFVNRCRVEHFKNAVLAPANAHLSLLAIAFESGFNSKAAFNTVFKKIVGMTPSDFARERAKERL